MQVSGARGAWHKALTLVCQSARRAKEIGGVFVKCDVSQEVDGQVAVAAALKLGKLVGLVSSAGIAPAEKTMGKNDPHALAAFGEAVTVNLIGSRTGTNLLTARLGAALGSAFGTSIGSGLRGWISASRNQRRNKFALIPRDIATAAIDMPGCAANATALALNSPPCRGGAADRLCAEER